jgi:hypothetical protein
VRDEESICILCPHTLGPSVDGMGRCNPSRRFMESIASANGLVDGLVDGNSGIPSTFPLGMVMSIIKQTDGLHHTWHPVYRWLVSTLRIVRNTKHCIDKLNTTKVLAHARQTRCASCTRAHPAADGSMSREQAISGVARPAR